MDFRTVIEEKNCGPRIDHSTPIVTIGSCFSDEIGSCLSDDGFNVLVNPLGTLYNPASIAAALRHTWEGTDPMQHIFQSHVDGLWHSWMHDSSFSGHSPEEVAAKIIEARAKVRPLMTNPKALFIITLGTVYVYHHQQAGVVANCHKMPANDFTRIALPLSAVKEQLTEISNFIPASNTLYTVSPIRHKSDGLMNNSFSKATLHVAIDEWINSLPHDYMDGRPHFYFPAYEALIDDLRDYRFYAADMVHPSDVAVKYIYDLFCRTFMSEDTRKHALECRRIAARSRHRNIIK